MVLECITTTIILKFILGIGSKIKGTAKARNKISPPDKLLLASGKMASNMEKVKPGSPMEPKSNNYGKKENK